MLRPLLLAGLLLALAVPTLPAHAQGNAGVGELHFVARDNGTAFWFEVDGSPIHDPVVAIEPGANVTILFNNAGAMPHGLRLGAPVGTGLPCCTPPGGNATFSFPMPTGVASVPYFCPLHRASGMAGLLVTTDIGSPAPASASRGAPLPAWLPLVALLAALAAAAARPRSQGVYRDPLSRRP